MKRCALGYHFIVLSNPFTASLPRPMPVYQKSFTTGHMVSIISNLYVMDVSSRFVIVENPPYNGVGKEGTTSIPRTANRG